MLDINEIKTYLKLYRNSKNVLIEITVPYNTNNDSFKMTLHIEKSFTDKMIDDILNHLKKSLDDYKNTSMKISFSD